MKTTHAHDASGAVQPPGLSAAGGEQAPVSSPMPPRLSASEDVAAPAVDLLDTSVEADTGRGVDGESATPRGCGAPGCPGCAPLSADLERILVVYRPSTRSELWEPVASQCRCLVRRTGPRSASIMRGRLSTLWAIVAEQLADRPEAMVAQLVTTASVNRLLVTVEFTHTERTRAGMRAAARALHKAASGTPYAARNSADQASGPRTRDRALSDRSRALMAAACSGTPLLAVIVARSVGFSALRALEAHLPAADLAAHGDVLRG